MNNHAMDLMAALVLEDGRTWGEAAHPVQLQDAAAVIDSAVPMHYWTRARGYAKTADAAGVAVALMLEAAPPQARLYWLAADAEQGQLAIDSIAGYRDRTPLLHDRLDVQSRRVVATGSGARLDILAADAASSWGLRPWLLVVDEFSAWGETPGPKRIWESVSSAVAKLPDARMLVVTSAGDPRSLAYEVLRHARTSALWRASETTGPSPWMAAERLAEQRARLPEPIYAALFENRWVEADGAFLDADAVRACFTLPGPSEPVDGRRYVGALDLGLVNDRTVLAVGHREGDALHLDHLRTWKGSRKAPVNIGEVRDAVIAADDRYGRLGVLRFDKWQAHRLAEELSAAGVNCEGFDFTSASKQRMSGALLQVVNDRRLRLYEPGALSEELCALTIRTTGSGWSFDHTRRGHDDQATALGMLVLELLTYRSAEVSGRSTIPRVGAAAHTIERAGFRLVGKRYLDRDADGALVPPRGWSRR